MRPSNVFVTVMILLAVLGSIGSLYSGSCCSYVVTESGQVVTTDTVTYHPHKTDSEKPLAWRVPDNFSNRYYTEIGEMGALKIFGVPNFTLSIETENLSTIFENLRGQSDETLYLFVQYWMSQPSLSWKDVIVSVADVAPKTAHLIFHDDPDSPFKTIEATFVPPIPNASLVVFFNMTGSLGSYIEMQVFGSSSVLEPNLITRTRTYPIEEWSRIGSIFPYSNYASVLLHVSWIAAVFGVVILLGIEIKEWRSRRKAAGLSKNTTSDTKAS